MNIQEILQVQAVWTYNILIDSGAVGETVREDCITSINLATINRLVEVNRIPLSITSTQGANLEGEFGTDWFWTLDPPKGSSFAVQAKRIDSVRQENRIGYLINIKQLSRLLERAEILSEQEKVTFNPIYVLYNSRIPNVSESEEAAVGCTFLSAVVMQGYLEGVGKSQQDSAFVTYDTTVKELGARPWFEMFGSGGE